MSNIKADVVIIGGGAAGLSAAVSVAESGAKAVVLEAKNSLGGNGIFPMGIYAVNSPVQRRNLIRATTEEAFLACMDYSHWRIDAKLTRTIIDRTGDTIEWLEGQGVEFARVMHHLPNQTPEVFHITDGVKRTGRAVIDALTQSCERLGVATLTAVRAKRLVFDVNGEVCAVTAEGGDGELTVEGRAFIIATGGFVGSAELIARFYPDYKPENHMQLVGIRHQGDGIKMAMEAGADIEGHFAMEMAAPKIPGHAPLGLLLDKPFPIWFNSDGERFTRESNVYDFTNCAQACSRQKGGVVYILLDEAIKEHSIAYGRGPLENFSLPEDAESRLDETIAAAEKAGIMKTASDLREAAEFMGVDHETLASAVEEYNGCCDRGYDTYFAKRREDLIALRKPPYYVVKAGVDVLATHGGIRVNERFEALDEDRRPIPGLYIAGMDIGGVDADVYNMNMSGHAFGVSVNSGRIAGEAACRRIKAQEA